MEKEYQVSWLKIVGITVLIAVVIVIICLIYPKKDNTLLTQQTYISNITLMKDAGFEYFTGSNLPQEVGDSERITLDEMLARNLIVDFFDEEGNSCNTTNSYIEATKTMDNEYEMSVYLSCDHKSDYIVTSISNEVVCTDCNVTIPEDKHIDFQDYIEKDYEECKKFKVNRTPSREKMWGNGINGNCPNVTKAHKINCITCRQDRWKNAGLVEFEDFCRFLTTKELEMGQTLPVGYTKMLSPYKASNVIGDGWTVDVIAHIFKGLKEE